MFVGLTLVLLSVTILPQTIDAYVNVRGYYRSDGTYVRPHVRSNPNGLKYDNYGYTPGQGLYNSTYGTRGAAWDTPTNITDPDYYIGKSLYESGSSGYASPSTDVKTKITNIPAHATASSYGSGWYCDNGYKTTYDNSFNKVGCEKVKVPKNAHLNYSGTDWFCDSGYETKYDDGFDRIGCKEIKIPKNAHLGYSGTDWFCDSGYKTEYDDSFKKTGCSKIIIPKHAHLNYFGNDWYCDDGYEAEYNDWFNKVGCKKE